MQSIKDIFKQDQIEDSTKNVKGGIRFHINSKEPKPVEILLQYMFSNEFDIAQDDLLNVNST
jgi:hypothetical protein